MKWSPIVRGNMLSFATIGVDGSVIEIPLLQIKYVANTYA